MRTARNRIEALAAGTFFVVRINVAKKVGGLHEAILLDYVVRWAELSRDGWVFRTEQEIEEDTMLSRHNQRTARTGLVGLGLLEEERRGVPARLYFRINYDALHDLLGDDAPGSGSFPTSPANLPNWSDKSAELYKETQEKTQEKESSLSRAKQLPRDWKPTPDEFQYAKERGFSNIEIDEMAEDFRLFYLSHGRAMPNWHLTFLRWVREEQKRRESRQSRQNYQQPSRPVYANTEQY